MQLHSIEEKDKIFPLPRLNHQFIGLGHQLESNRRERRKIQLEHQAIQNRVLLLQKQQQKARKNLIKKKSQLCQIINKRQRQDRDNQQKEKARQLRMQELDRLKKQNQFIRLIHKTNLNYNMSTLRDKNHSDYSKIRQQRIDGEYSKKVQKNRDLSQKRDHWISLNLSKQKGKMRINQFYKQKNQEHIKQYQSRINLQNKERQSRINSIKSLQAKQQSLRQKLQNTTMKNSKIEQMIKNISKTIEPLDTSKLQAQLYSNTQRTKKSRHTIQVYEKQLSVTRTNSGDNKKYPRSYSNNYSSFGQYVQENIQLADDKDQKGGFRLVHTRRKNKHKNRYKQYEAY